MSERKQLVVVANRLPVRVIREGRRRRIEWSPGGLVTALIPILSQYDGIWVGWNGSEGKRQESFTYEGIHNLSVPMNADEIEAFYDGFSNRTIWPLYHDAVRWPEYHRVWWKPYKDINRRFAEMASKVAARGAMVWVHDYQLQLVPSMLREMRPDLRIGFFLHIPFPPQELFSQLPWRRQILEGLLGADVVGFQTRIGAQNFSRLARRYTEASGGDKELCHQGRTVRVSDFPVSIDFKRFEELAKDPEVEARMEALRQELGPGRRVIFGVDRLDYTKGIDIRLKAYHELLRNGTATLDDVVLVQCAVPSREQVLQYADLKIKVEQLVGSINGEFAQVGKVAVHYLYRSLPVEELVALYRLADVMLVTPLRDGMNLVAKEYVACRRDNTGALVLSEFTGASNELKKALQVNPHDVDALGQTLERALHLPPEEMRTRMKSLRSQVRRHDVYAWSRLFFDALTT